MHRRISSADKNQFSAAHSRLNKTSDDFKFKRVQICTSSPSLSRDIQFVEYEITFKIPPETIKRITEILNDTDSLSYVDNKLVLKMDYSNQGQERFSKIYKMIDPQKKFTAHLIRKKVTLFNSPA